MARSKFVSGSCFNPLKLKNHSRTKRNELSKIHVEWLKRLNIPITQNSSKYRICNSCRLKVWKMPKAVNDTGNDDSESTADTDERTENGQSVPLASKPSPATAPHVMLEDCVQFRRKDDSRSSDSGLNDVKIVVKTESYRCCNPMRLENHDRCKHSLRPLTTKLREYMVDQCTEEDTHVCNSCRIKCTKLYKAKTKNFGKPVQAPAPVKIEILTQESDLESVSIINETSDLGLQKPPSSIKKEYSSVRKRRSSSPAKLVKFVRFEQDSEEGYIGGVNKDHHRMVEVVEMKDSREDGKHKDHRKRVSFSIMLY